MRNTYQCCVKKKDILKCIQNHESYDTWGDVQYGNDKRAVDYNIYIDNSTETTEYCSAFYRFYENEEGYWQHDGCQDWYSYEIDFSDKNWKEKLKEAAKKAYEELWKE